MQADPSTIPDKDFVLPEPRSEQPFANGIPLLPDVCDPDKLTEDCFKALDADEHGAYLYFENNHTCTQDEQYKVKLGLWDSQDLLKYASRWSVERSSRDVVSAEYWMGSNWREYATRIKGNLGRASDFVNNKDNKKSYISISCRDPQTKCKKRVVGQEKKVVGGYAWNVDWSFWTYGHINMCRDGPYYKLEDIPGTMDHINYYRKTKQIDKLQNMRYYQSYGQYFLHEMMHLRSTWYPEPHIEDKYLKGAEGKFDGDLPAYGPKNVHRLAKIDAEGDALEISGAKVSTINADSYAMLVNSIFWWDVTQYFPGVPGNKEGDGPPTIDPPPIALLPTVYMGNLSDISTLSIGSIDDALNTAIDLALADETSSSSAPAAQDNNACHGISGDYWVMSRDVAIDNVKDFCSQNSLTKKYNEGSVNELELSVKKLNDTMSTQGPQNAPDCIGYFQNAVLDGCDGADVVNNPHNYKFGSTLTTASGWEFKMTPLSKQVNEVNCDVSYKFWFDRFEIRGKNLPDALLGANGEGLRDELSGCGALTNWNFERTPEDCCFQWYATGQLPVGTKACVGRALMSAGGSGKGHCKRKRRVDDFAIDNWPGYGDENMHVFNTTSSPLQRDDIDTWPGYGDESKHVFKNGKKSSW